jgi:hypothetical protein
MKEILDKTPSVAERAARFAPRSGDPVTRSPSRRPPLAMAAHALPPPTSPPLLAYSTFEAAKIARVCRSILYREIRAGRLIARKSGRSTIILDDDLRSWLAALPRLPAGPAAEWAADTGREDVAS